MSDSANASGDLHIRIAEIPDDHIGSSVSLVSFLPEPTNVAAFFGDRLRVVGWGTAISKTFVGSHSIYQSARWWDDVSGNAVIEDHGHSLFPSEQGYPRLPVAVASYGFSSSTPSVVTIPQTAVVETNGKRIAVAASLGHYPTDPLTAIERALAARHRSPVTQPQGLLTQVGRMSQTQWVESVRRLTHRLQQGSASKAVMSRDMVISSATPLDERHLIERLLDLYPTTWIYAVSGLIGATPEILVSMRDHHLISRVLAGTSAPDHEKQLMMSMKDRNEHILAVDSVARSLAPIADNLKVPSEPEILHLPNVIHLASDVTATVNTGSVLDVAAALHPTAAVCGTPTALAYDLLESFEQTQRGRYSGPVGWVDACGDGEFGIALRCGQISDDHRSMRAFAGSGVMPDSVPELELAETRAKMKPILEALGL